MSLVGINKIKRGARSENQFCTVVAVHKVDAIECKIGESRLYQYNRNGHNKWHRKQIDFVLNSR